MFPLQRAEEGRLQGLGASTGGLRTGHVTRRGRGRTPAPSPPPRHAKHCPRRGRARTRGRDAGAAVSLYLKSRGGLEPPTLPSPGPDSVTAAAAVLHEAWLRGSRVAGLARTRHEAELQRRRGFVGTVPPGRGRGLPAGASRGVRPTPSASPETGRGLPAGTGQSPPGACGFLGPSRPPLREAVSPGS